MEHIAKSDVKFLIALNASEESPLSELRLDLQRWKHEGTDPAEVLVEMIRDGTVLLAESVGNSVTDYSVADSEALAAGWSTSESHSKFIFLTDSGWKRWDTDDWGITTDRAKRLMFYQKDGISRIEAAPVATALRILFRIFLPAVIFLVVLYMLPLVVRYFLAE